jgi:hypothetical protein
MKLADAVARVDGSDGRDHIATEEESLSAWQHLADTRHIHILDGCYLRTGGRRNLRHARPNAGRLETCRSCQSNDQ